MNCLCAVYVNQNQQAFWAQLTSFVVRYCVIYHSSLSILTQHLMTWGVDSPAVGLSRQQFINDVLL